MRHDPIDPARSPGLERPPADSTLRVFGPRLDALERRALAAIAASEQELEALGSRTPGGPDDEAARTGALAVLSDIQARERTQLDEILAARARLVHGTFGACERCGGRIPLSRLEALPAARHCLACQKEAERHEAAVATGSR